MGKGKSDLQQKQNGIMHLPITLTLFNILTNFTASATILVEVSLKCVFVWQKVCIIVFAFHESDLRSVRYMYFDATSNTCPCGIFYMIVDIVKHFPGFWTGGEQDRVEGV